MDVLFSLEHIQWQTPGLKLSRQHEKQRTHEHRHYLHVYTQHVAVNMVGARHQCSVVFMLGHCRHWRHRLDKLSGHIYNMSVRS